MAWSKFQKIRLLTSAKLAGWNDQQRYIAMRHVGCPTDRLSKQPSVNHPRNAHTHYELVMALAESVALSSGNGDAFPRAGNGRLWREAAERTTDRMCNLIRDIEREALTRVPAVFSPGFLEGFIARMTANDAHKQPHIDTVTLVSDLDPGQAYRVLEGLKAWVGRAMADRGLTPRSFKWSSTGHRGGQMEAA